MFKSVTPPSKVLYAFKGDLYDCNEFLYSICTQEPRKSKSFESAWSTVLGLQPEMKISENKTAVFMDSIMWNDSMLKLPTYADLKICRLTRLCPRSQRNWPQRECLRTGRVRKAWQ
jgi:hypothetical protein